jgi:hypothetical protein
LPVSFIGIHTPEFDFAQEARQVEAALRRYGVEYPVLLDNHQANWDRFANRYWPTLYLIDANGYLRYQHAGEGRYAESEAALIALVAEAAQQAGQVDLALPRPLGALRAEDLSGAACFRATPELHTGFRRGALGNPEGYLPHGLPMLYRLPPPPACEDGYFYLGGLWQSGDDHVALAGDRGTLVLPYHAATANAVLAASADPVALMLDLKPAARVVVTQDGAPLDSLAAGDDVVRDGGAAYVCVDAPRMYHLARNPDGRPHTLRLEFSQKGAAVFAFSFSTCVVAAP